MPNTSGCIVGLGLMGGSLALALREARWADRLIGVDRDPATLAAAEACRRDRSRARRIWRQASRRRMWWCWRHRCARSCASCRRSAATPAPGALVMDLGSTKQQICRAMTGLPEGLEPVGGHPDVRQGSRRVRVGRGGAVSRDDLRALPRLAHLAGCAGTGAEPGPAIGARPVVLDPAIHDRAVAAISHLPYAVAVSAGEHRRRRAHARLPGRWRLPASATPAAWRPATWT